MMQSWFVPRLCLDELSGTALRRAEKIPDSGSVWSAIAARFGLRKFPFAQAHAMAAGLPETAHWCCADPVHLRADHKGIYLLGSNESDVSATESQELLKALNEWLAQDQLQLHALTHTQWLLQLSVPLQFDTTPLHEAIGRDIAALLPPGKEALRWQSRVLEWQMLLQRHAVNLQRQAEGRQPLASLWLWGESDVEVQAASFDGAPWFTDSVWLAHWLRVHAQTVSMISVDQLRQQTLPANANIVLLQAQQHWCQADRVALAQFSRQLLTQLPAQALQLRTGDAFSYHYQPAPGWQFWRH